MFLVLVVASVLPGLGVAGEASASRVPAVATTSPYGLNNWDFSARDVRMLKATGAGWARVMVCWGRYEPTPGHIDWTWLDNAVRHLHQAGLAIDFSYYQTPGWALQPGAVNLARPAAMARFVGACAARYKGKVDAHEIYNEDVCNAWPHVAERSAWRYVPVLQACYRAVKAVAPNQLVIAGGLWQFPMYYVEDMYKAGAKGYFDALNWHYYIPALPDGPAFQDSFRGDFSFGLYYLHYITEKYGDPKPIWITEVGWSVSRENQSSPASLADQARYLAYAYRHAMETGFVAKIFWYVFYMQDGMALIHRNDSSAQFGPAATADYHRPAYRTMCDFIARYPRWNSSRVKVPPLPAPAEHPARIPNPGFESTGSWSLPAGATQVREAYTGRYALRIVGGNRERRAVSEQFPVEGGRCYELHGWLKIGGGWADARVGHAMWQIEFFDRTGRRLNVVGPLHDEREGNQNSSNYYINDTFGRWQEVHYPVIVPATARSACVAARVAGPVSVHRRRRDRAAAKNPPPPPRTIALFDNVSLVPLDVRPKG